jgi:predicted transcriptional regulator
MSRLGYCKFSNEDLEAAAGISRAYRRQFHLSRLQLAVMLDCHPARLADLENCRDPQLDWLVDSVFAIAEDLE